MRLWKTVGWLKNALWITICWKILFLWQVSRSIGDAYLKKAEFNREPLLPRFRLPEPFFKPILSSEPSISVHKLRPEDQFLIFASDGLWEHLTNQEAVNIVNNYPRNVRFHCLYFKHNYSQNNDFWLIFLFLCNPGNCQEACQSCTSRSS